MNKLTSKYLGSVVVIFAISSNIQASDISYNYIEGIYGTKTDSSLGDDRDAKINGLAGSWAISPNIAFAASYSATSFDRVLGIDIDATELTVGAAIHAGVSASTDVVGNISMLVVNIDIEDGFTTKSDKDTGLLADIGVRHRATEVVEINSRLIYENIFDDSSLGFGFGARFFLKENISIGAEYTISDDIDIILLSGRMEL